MILAREDFLQDSAKILVWYPFRWFTRALSPHSNFSLFEMIGDLACHLYRGKQALLFSRISSIFSDWAAERVTSEVRVCFRNYYADRFIVNLVPLLNGNNISEIAYLQGEAHLTKALARGRGAVLVHAHFGPSQLPLLYLGHKGYAIAQIGLRERSKRYIANKTDAVRLSLEQQMPVKHFFADRYQREVLRWLEQGHVLMTAGDGTGGGMKIGKFHQAELFGRVLQMPLGPYRLASLTDAPVVPVIVLRERRGFYRIQIDPPLSVDHPVMMQKQFTGWLEGYLSQAPGLWHFWDEWDPNAE